jgi:uncharacterized membrane protein
MLFVLQALLALTYALLAHAASHGHDERVGAAALAALVLLVLLRPLARGGWRPWLWLVAALLGVAWLAYHGHTRLPLLLVPTALIGLVASWFARSLRAGRVPLIGKIVAAMERVPPAQLAPPLADYTRRLTGAWALMLGALALFNLALALIAVPDGILAHLGWTAPLRVTRTQWSWFANVCNYGLIAGFFAAEYQLRKRRFPGRYRNFADFVRRLAGLGQPFWRDFLH